MTWAELFPAIYNALHADSDIAAATNGRIYFTSPEMPDSDLERIDVPYIILMDDGLQNARLTKDDDGTGGWYDRATVTVEIVAPTDWTLPALVTAVRRVVAAVVEADGEAELEGYEQTGTTFAAAKPAHWLDASFTILTKNPLSA